MKIECLNLRPCKCNGENYLFHCWEHFSEIVEPSPLMGGHCGGVDENGKVFRVPAYEITFTDNKFKEYCKREEIRDGQNYYKNMPEDFQKAVEVIREYCQNEERMRCRLRM